MSTGTAGSGSLPNTTAAGTSAQPAKRERYIERQLRRTRRQVRGVELASRLMLLAAAAVAFFLLAAVVDHWIVPGGLSIYGRLAAVILWRGRLRPCSSIESIHCLPRKRSSAPSRL
jgi:hypothetical protein